MRCSAKYHITLVSKDCTPESQSFLICTEMKTTDQLTARQLLEIFYDTVKVSQMTDQSYHECLELLRAAPLDQPFTVANKNDRWLLVYCLDYKAPMIEQKVSLFDTLADAIRAGLNYR